MKVLALAESTPATTTALEVELRSQVRFADRVAWAAADAVRSCLHASIGLIETNPDDIGVIAICGQGPVTTLREVALVAQEVLASPLRFPAASPGSIAALACISAGAKGPSLCLVMTPTAGIRVAMDIARVWLAGEHALLTFIVICANDTTARAALLGPEETDDDPRLSTFDLWLAHISNEGERGL